MYGYSREVPRRIIEALMEKPRERERERERERALYGILIGRELMEFETRKPYLQATQLIGA